MGFLTDLISNGAASLVSAVGDAIDKNVTSDAERKELENELAKSTMQYELQMATLSLQEKQAFLGDTASARENQSRVQEAEHASWMAKNVHPILALSIIALTFILYAIVMFGGTDVIVNKDSKDIVIYILGALTTIATQVVSYFFGSSAGSADKSKALNELVKNKPR
jgi:hypothetical protein